MDVRIEFLQYDNKVHDKQDDWSVVCCSRSEDKKGEIVYHRTGIYIDGKMASLGSMNGASAKGALMYELLQFLHANGQKNIRIKEQAFPGKEKYNEIWKEYRANGESYVYAGGDDFA